MAVEAAIEALQATSDLVSQTKMGQLFKPSFSLSPHCFFSNQKLSDTKSKIVIS